MKTQFSQDLEQDKDKAKTARQARGSYLRSIVIHLEADIAGGQPRYLSLGSPSRYLSPAADSLDSKSAGGPKTKSSNRNCENRHPKYDI